MRAARKDGEYVALVSRGAQLITGWHRPGHGGFHVAGQQFGCERSECCPVSREICRMTRIVHLESLQAERARLGEEDVSRADVTMRNALCMSVDESLRSRSECCLG